MALDDLARVALTELGVYWRVMIGCLLLAQAPFAAMLVLGSSAISRRSARRQGCTASFAVISAGAYIGWRVVAAPQFQWFDWIVLGVAVLPTLIIAVTVARRVM